MNCFFRLFLGPKNVELLTFLEKRLNFTIYLRRVHYTRSMSKQTEKSTISIANHFTNAALPIQQDDFDILVAYSGEFSKDLVNSIPESVELKLQDYRIRKNNIKRIFSILIEGLQNIRKHSDFKDENNHLGYVYVARKPHLVKLYFANLVNQHSIDALKHKLEKLEAMSEEELKDYYREILNNGLMSDLGGAGLGLITMVMKSNKTLDYQLKEMADGVHLFSVAVDIETAV